MTPQEVAVLLWEHGSRRGQTEADGSADGTADAHVHRRQRTGLLADVLSSCNELWSAGSEELDLMAERLGDGSRDVAWRLPYGESGILDFFVALLAQGNLRQKLHIHALRLIGNSCADTNENRARLVDRDRLLAVTKYVADERLIPFNIPVIYNILVDYEPAQSLASKSHLSKQLIGLLSLPHISKYAPFVPYICKVLALLVTQDGEAASADPATVRLLLALAGQPAAKEDVEDFISLATVAVAYLANETLQSRLIADNQVPLLMDAFYHVHVEVDVGAVEDEDVVAQVKQLRSSLLSTLADVSGNDSFALAYPLSHGVPQALLDWIRGGNRHLQPAACLALGNISRSDDASIALVQHYRAHEPLVKLLSDPDVADSQLLHAACSFLKNLAIPLANKPQLRDLLLPQCVPRLYALDTLPQVQFAAVSLTRLLLLNCPANVRQICAPLENPSSGATTIAGKPGVGGETSVARITALYERSDAEPTRLAAARCVAAVCRVLHSTPAADTLPNPSSHSAEKSSSRSDEQSRRGAFYTAHALHGPLRFLITQTKWPSLRSEAWFVLALMARSSRDGARLVLSLLDDETAEASLQRTITGGETAPNRREEGREDAADQQGEETFVADYTAPPPQLASAASDLQLEPQQVDAKQKASMAKVDAENALILCSELVKLGDGTLTTGKSALLKRLVRTGTRRVVTDRAQLSQEEQGQEQGTSIEK